MPHCEPPARGGVGGQRGWPQGARDPHIPYPYITPYHVGLSRGKRFLPVEPPRGSVMRIRIRLFTLMWIRVRNSDSKKINRHSFLKLFRSTKHCFKEVTQLVILSMLVIKLIQQPAPVVFNFGGHVCMRLLVAAVECKEIMAMFLFNLQFERKHSHSTIY